MKSDAARQMMEAAREKAVEIGKPVSVAIVDAGGSLMALERLMRPFSGGPGVSPGFQHPGSGSVPRLSMPVSPGF